MHDVVKRVAHSVVHRELGHYKPSGWFVVNDMRAEHENMSSNRWLIELGEARVIGVSAYC